MTTRMFNINERLLVKTLFVFTCLVAFSVSHNAGRYASPPVLNINPFQYAAKKAVGATKTGSTTDSDNYSKTISTLFLMLAKGETKNIHFNVSSLCPNLLLFGYSSPDCKSLSFKFPGDEFYSSLKTGNYKMFIDSIKKSATCISLNS